jgi:hypothetical protein
MNGSFLAWLDHDPDERARTQRVLALFRERESRDELGLGSVRDAVADALFPGTSTIETRLRYVLFVAWTYQKLEDERVAATDVERLARKRQLELIPQLLKEETLGVFGRVSGGNLRRLPSEVYWATMASWGVLRFRGSMDAYHRAFDRLAERSRVRRKETDEGDDGVLVTWDRGLPKAPADFPQSANFALRRAEAVYLRDRLVESFPESLFAWLANDEGSAGAPSVEFPWEQARHAAFRREHREQLHHGRLFTEVMYGAAILYNLALAELRGADERREELRAEQRTWINGLDGLPVDDWSPDRLFHLFASSTHVISPATRSFVSAWRRLVLTRDPEVLDGREARALVRAREVSLKGPRSRYTNPRALDQWSGAAGLFRLNYRWTTAQRFLHDIHQGLRQGDD